MVETFDKSIDIVFESSIDALFELGFEIKYKNKKDGIIGASTGTSIFSWGESIDLSITKLGAVKTRVEVKSSSNAQLFAWGKNEENEKSVLETLSKLISKR